MKTLFARNILLAAAAFGALVSCGKNGGKVQEPSVRLLTDMVQVDAAGGTASIGYEIQNPVDGQRLAAVADADWAGTFEDAGDGSLTFVVAANAEPEERSCKVSVSYEGAAGVEFTVVQAGAAEQPSEISFGLSYEVDGTAVRMSVVPSEKDVYYYYDVVAVSELGEDTPEAVEAYCRDQLALILKGYESWGVSVPEALADFASKGDTSFRFPDLEQECDYYGYAYALDASAAMASDVTYSGFKTAKVEPSDNVLDITVSDVTTTSAVLTIKPSNEDQYTFLVTFADDFEGMADEEILMMLVDGFELQPVTGMIDRETVGGMEPGTNYVVFAFGYQGGMATTGLFKSYFATPLE